MPYFDLSPAELEGYLPEIAEPADFDAFWAATLDDSRRAGWDPRLTPVDSALRSVDVFDVSFAGFGGDPIKAWLLLPAGATEPLPAVVAYIGYGGGRGLPSERLAWSAAGYAHLIMDTRGQGSTWGAGGDTPDPHGTGAAANGYMTRGIQDPADYYYRRVFTDAVRAVDAIRTLPEIDAARVAVTGESQGGGIALAAGALSEGLVAVMPDVPFLCHFSRAVGLTDREPYQELVRYLSVHRDARERTFATLSYFDGVSMARRASAPGLFSVALMDFTCPPSTVYAAFNAFAHETKRIVAYEFNDHEGGGAHQWIQQAEFLAELGIR